jgi:hypothetical protein
LGFSWSFERGRHRSGVVVVVVGGGMNGQVMLNCPAAVVVVVVSGGGGGGLPTGLGRPWTLKPPAFLLSCRFGLPVKALHCQSKALIS